MSFLQIGEQLNIREFLDQDLVKLVYKKIEIPLATTSLKCQSISKADDLKALTSSTIAAVHLMNTINFKEVFSFDNIFDLICQFQENQSKDKLYQQLQPPTSWEEYGSEAELGTHVSNELL